MRKGRTILINLDNETEGSACVSTAGNAVLSVVGKAETEAPALDTALSIRLHGLAGGHSGLSINAGRINANTALAELLLTLDREGIAYELASFAGGTVHNAIPNEAEAVITVKGADKSRVTDAVQEAKAGFVKAYASTDDGVEADITPVALPGKVFTAAQKARILDFIGLIPNGVNTMSGRVAGLVESSSNLGVVQADADGIACVACVRSSEQFHMDSILLRQTRLAALCGFTSEVSYGSDAWPVDTDAKLPGLLAKSTGSKRGRRCFKKASMRASNAAPLRA